MIAKNIGHYDNNANNLGASDADAADFGTVLTFAPSNYLTLTPF